MKLILFLFVAGAHLQLIRLTSAEESVITGCTEVHLSAGEKLAYIGWPFQLDCSVFFREPEYKIYDIYDEEDLTSEDKMKCVIAHANGSVLLSYTTTYNQLQDYSGNINSVLLPDLKQGDPVDFEITLTATNVSQCLKINFRLNLVPFQQITCENFTSGGYTRIPSRLGQIKHFHCIPSHRDYPKLYSNENLPNMKYTWWRNCSTLPSDVTVARNNNLDIRSVAYKDAGLYTCAVTHNGMTRFVTSYPVCVQQPGSVSQQTLTCNQEVYYTDVGSDVMLECTGNFGDGTITEHQFRAFWKKKNGSDPRIFCNGSKNLARITGSSDTLCTYDLKANQCYMHIADAEERIVKTALLPIRLYIKNAKPSDFGSYTISLTSNLMGSKVAEKTIILQEKKDALEVAENFLNLTGYQIIGIGAGVLVLIIIIIACVCYFNFRKPKYII